jgi:hypothetical protein
MGMKCELSRRRCHPVLGGQHWVIKCFRQKTDAADVHNDLCAAANAHNDLCAAVNAHNEQGAVANAHHRLLSTAMPSTDFLSTSSDA